MRLLIPKRGKLFSFLKQTLLWMGLMVASAGAQQTDDSKKWSVIVGVGYYENIGFGRLDYTVFDALAIRNALMNVDERYQAETTFLLVDNDKNLPQPTRENIETTIRKVVTQAGPRDTVLVYFAGHGMISRKDGQLYLLPRDSQYDRIELSSYSYETLRTLLANSAAREKILVLDACYSGAARSPNLMDPKMESILDDESEGLVILASCSKDEVSFPYEKMMHGAFTYFLLEGLRGLADDAVGSNGRIFGNGDGRISSAELHEYVRFETAKWADDNNLKQTPRYTAMLSGRDIVIGRSKNFDSVKDLVKVEGIEDLGLQYGRGIAQLSQGRIDDAETVFESLPEGAMKSEGLASVKYLRNDAEAQSAIEEIYKVNPTPYVATLLSRTNIAAGDPQAAVDRLASVADSDFQYDWQYWESQRTLGQAYFALGDYAAAQSIFDSLIETTPASSSHFKTSALYIQLCKNRLKWSDYDEIRTIAENIRKLRDERGAVATDDRVDKRPVTFFVTPPMLSDSLVSLDVDLPALGGELELALNNQPRFELVNREQLDSTLRELNISETLDGSETTRFSGARIFLTLSIMKRFSGHEALHISFTEVGTSKKFELSPIPVSPRLFKPSPSEAADLIRNITREIKMGVSKKFPMKGILTIESNMARINIGEAAGVTPRQRFQVYDRNGDFPLPNAYATVLEVADEVSKVALQGITMEDLEEGEWVVKEIPEKETEDDATLAST